MGNSQLPGMVSKLSGSTKGVASSIMTDPHKIENIIGMVRTFAPLTSPQTVSKVNTYLPLMEKTSTLMGMYSFLNRAQTYRPLEALDAKTPTEKISALVKSGNLPIGKIAQPLISSNVEKIMGGVAMNMLKNGSLNDILKNGGMNDMLKNGVLNDMLKNGNINDILSSVANQGNTSKNSEGNTGNSENNIDLSSLMETFMPLINSMASNQSQPDKKTQAEEPKKISKPREVKPTAIKEFKNETNLTDDAEEQTETDLTLAKDVSLHEEIIDEAQRQNHKPLRIKHRRRI